MNHLVQLKLLAELREKGYLNWKAFISTHYDTPTQVICYRMELHQSISISSQKCPRGGTAMFAFLALAGDFGATVSPAMVGGLSEMAGGNLKTGLLVATIFPVILVVGLIVLYKVKNE